MNMSISMDNFKENEKHELALANKVMKQRHADRKRRGISIQDIFRFKRKYERSFEPKINHLSRKRMKCYPRGPAFNRIMDIELGI